MTGVGGSNATGSCGDVRDLRSPSLELLDDPLEYLLAEHMRYRCLCAQLRRIADAGTVDRDMADAIASLLEREQPLHHQDEELDLFPAVLRRALPEDDLTSIIAGLERDHGESRLDAALIATTLTESTDGKLKPAVGHAMKSYADAQHRHLAIENGIVMVIARKRLKPDDLIRIGRRMKLRRGVIS